MTYNRFIKILNINVIIYQFEYFYLVYFFSETWHQYDGFIYRPKTTGVVDMLKGWFWNIRHVAKKDTKKAAEHFLPSTKEIVQSLEKEDESGHAEDLLKTISAVMGCLRFQMIHVNSVSIDEQFYAEVSTEPISYFYVKYFSTYKETS